MNIEIPRLEDLAAYVVFTQVCAKDYPRFLPYTAPSITPDGSTEILDWNFPFTFPRLVSIFSAFDYSRTAPWMRFANFTFPDRSHREILLASLPEEAYFAQYWEASRTSLNTQKRLRIK